MKRALSCLLSVMLVLSGVQLPVYAQDTLETVDVMPETAANAGRLEVVLRMDYRESAETLKNRKLSLTLIQDNKAESKIVLGASDQEKDFTIGKNRIRAQITLLNPQDAPLAPNDKVGFYLVEFSGLPASSKYQFRFEGEGYRTVTVPETAASIDEYVPRVYISAESGGFALGDVTSDKQINQKDLDEVSKALGQSSKAADLNLDGVVDITDIALVHHNMVSPRPAEVYEGELVTAGVLETGTMANELEHNGLQILVDGAEKGTAKERLENLFLDNGKPVTIKTNDKECEIPIVFHEPKEMSEISIISPAVKGALEKGSVVVEYTSGESDEIPFDITPPEDTHATERTAGQSTVVIPLNGRVPVKKITIKVEKVVGEDGKVSFAVIEKIEFLKDIIPENLDLGASIPKNLYAEAGSKQATLTWRKVDNVDGYIVRYGTAPGALTLQLRVGSNQAVVTGLENLKTYYFTVSAYSGDWTSSPSVPASCIPQPSSKPLPPDNLSLTPEDSAIVVNWKKAEDAEFYNLYYKESAASQYKLAAEKTAAVSYTVSGLTNDVSYDFYVTAGNKIGFSRPSLVATGAPEKEILNFPTLPTLNRIPNSDIISVTMDDPGNVSSEYGGKFDISWVYDEDFETHWTGQSWWRSSRFTFEFNEEKSMDYLVYVPRLNKGYPESFAKYSVTVWDKDGNMTHLTSDQGKLGNNNDGDVAAPTVRNNPKETGYAILPFERNDHIKKISVMVRQWNGAPKPSPSLAEIAFYTYDDIDDSIEALFTDRTYTQINPATTQGQIDQLYARLENTEGYYVNKDILKDELDLAQALLNNDSSKLGRIIDDVQSRDTSGDKKTINTFQPIGVTAQAGTQIVVYAEIPEGETVNLIPTQHFAEAAKWSGSAIKLESGRNIITIPQINNVSPQKGGSLYLQYAGTEADSIKLHVRGGVQIPLLELSDWHKMSEEQVKSKITAYIDELNSYYTARLSGMNSGTLETHYLNATEIAFPHVLLSLPATQVRSALGSNGVETLYNDGLAWEELMQLMYRTHGIDEDDLEISRSRHNIRYMRMFGKAFMYASGNHIGIGYGSCSGMIAGRPFGTGSSGYLFGWGIHHEIGHVMDTLGKAEITNNIYALFAQTYDAGQNTGRSRLENSNKYEKIFEKVTSGQKGMSNDVFVSLGMYWQLHLAYDGADDNFYYRVNQELRSGGYSGSIDERFMAAASTVSGHDLSEFFESWGFDSSGQGGSKEERKLQYLTDESRRERLAGILRQSGTVGIQADYNRDTRKATVTITPTSGAKMQGYEISRTLNSKTETVAFLSAASGVTTWEDALGSVNNKAVTYSVKAVDILGYVIAEDTSGQIDISHDNLIDRTAYTWDTSKLEEGVLTATFDGQTSVAGIKFSGFGQTEQPTEPAEPTEPTEPQADSESTEPVEPTEPTEPTESSEPTNSSGTQDTADASESEETIDDEPVPHVGAPEFELEQDEEIPPKEQGQEPQPPQTDNRDSKADGQLPQDESPIVPHAETGDEESSESSEAPISSQPTTEEDGQTSDEQQSSETPEEPPADGEDTENPDIPAEPTASDTPAESEQPEQPAPVTEETAPQETQTNDNTEGKVLVEVSTDGSSFTTVLELDYQDIRSNPGKLRLFTRKDADGSICPVDAKLVRISGLPAGITTEDLDFAAYPGDFIEFGENGIGILGEAYGDIQAGTLVVTGNFRGNPVFNTVRVYGCTQNGDMAADGELNENERIPIAGEVYLFAAIPETGDMAEIDNGLWIFVPDQQEDTMSDSDQGCANSLLPTRIMAELHRTDVPEGGAGRITSDTRWIPSPTYESMPTIILED